MTQSFMRAIPLIALLPATALAFPAGTTNTVFVTDDSFSKFAHITAEVKLDTGYGTRMRAEAAKKIRECRPADQFPEGNWGKAEHGYQMSLRFDETNCASGEPITATILLRNVSDADLSYWQGLTAGADQPISFDVSDSRGSVAPNVDHAIRVGGSATPIALLSGTQQKFVERLNTRFGLKTRGYYTVRSWFRIAAPQPGPKPFILRSADVQLHIGDR